MQSFKVLFVIAIILIGQFCLAQKVISSLSPNNESNTNQTRAYVLDGTDLYIAQFKNRCEIEIIYSDGTDQNTKVLLNFNTENQGYLSLFELYNDKLIVQTQKAVYAINTLDKSTEVLFEIDSETYAIESAGIYKSWILIVTKSRNANEYYFDRVNLTNNTVDHFVNSYETSNISFDRDMCKFIYNDRMYYSLGDDLFEFNISTGESAMVFESVDFDEVVHQHDSLFFFKIFNEGFVRFNSVSQDVDSIYLGDDLRAPNAQILFDESNMSLIKDSLIMRIDLLTNTIDTLEQLNTDRYQLIGFIEGNIFYTSDGDFKFINKNNDQFDTDVRLSHIQSEFLIYQDTLYMHNGFEVYSLDDTNNTFETTLSDFECDFVTFIGATENRFYLDVVINDQFQIGTYDDSFKLLKNLDLSLTSLNQSYHQLNNELWLQYYNEKDFQREIWKLVDDKFEFMFYANGGFQEVLTPQVFHEAFYYKIKISDSYYKYYRTDLNTLETTQLVLPSESRNSYDLYFINNNLIFVGIQDGKIFRYNSDDSFELLTEIESDEIDEKHFMVFNDFLFFINDDEVWSSDGLRESTKRVFKFNDSSSSENIFHFFNDELYFTYETQFGSFSVSKMNFSSNRIETIFAGGDMLPTLKNTGDDHLVLQSYMDFYYLIDDEFVLIEPENKPLTLSLEAFVGGGDEDLFFKGRDISNSGDNFYRWNILDNSIFYITDYSSNSNVFKDDVMYFKRGFDFFAYDYDLDSIVSLNYLFDCEFVSILLSIDENIIVYGYKEGKGYELCFIDDSELSLESVIDLWEGQNSSHPFNFFEFDGEFYFDAIDENTGRQIWSFKNGTVNVQDLEKVKSHVIIYPNPTSDFLSIDVSNTEYILGVLVDVNGKEIQRHILSDEFSQIDVGNLSAGIYFMRFMNGKNSKAEVQRFVKVD